jgi:membrane protein YdbS with pleckstrin-like domain
LWAIWRRADRFVVTTYRVVVIRGIVSRFERAVPLTHIQDVTLRTPALQPSSVRLSTAGGTLGVQGMGPLSRAKARELADAIQGELIRR